MNAELYQRFPYQIVWKELNIGSCESWRGTIQLPPNLQYVCEIAFAFSSLQAIFIPPTVTDIGDDVFMGCKSLHIISIPHSLQNIGYGIIRHCNDLLVGEIEEVPQDEQLLWLRNRYNPLHSLCWDTSVTAEAISDHIQKPHENEERARTNDKPLFTALHLLAANPSVTAKMITTYLQLAPDVAIMQDNIGQTPLHILCSVPHLSAFSSAAITAYLGCSEGRITAFMKDSEGRTPFECLCQKSFDDLLFLKNKSFGGLLVWWHESLSINLFAWVKNVQYFKWVLSARNLTKASNQTNPRQKRRASKSVAKKQVETKWALNVL